MHSLSFVVFVIAIVTVRGQDAGCEPPHTFVVSYLLEVQRSELTEQTIVYYQTDTIAAMSLDEITFINAPLKDYIYNSNEETCVPTHNLGNVNLAGAPAKEAGYAVDKSSSERTINGLVYETTKVHQKTDTPEEGTESYTEDYNVYAEYLDENLDEKCILIQNIHTEYSSPGNIQSLATQTATFVSTSAAFVLPVECD